MDQRATFWAPKHNDNFAEVATSIPVFLAIAASSGEICHFTGTAF